MCETVNRSSTTTSNPATRMSKRSAIGAAVAALALAACVTPPPASERVTDAARALNVATRFSRMDVALQSTAPSFRSDFIKRRAGWGDTVRVLDVELAGLNMKDAAHATIQVDVSWNAANSSLLQRTRLEQTWSDEGRGFVLVRERRLAGDIGLFSEALGVQPDPRPDVHFPSKTLR